jgi:hypothetical protein
MFVDHRKWLSIETGLMLTEWGGFVCRGEHKDSMNLRMQT